MARTKQVFPRDEVAHLWAHKAQDSARDPSGNVYFTGPTIYSYRDSFAMAHILSDGCGPSLAGRVLWNNERYSNTTTKHQSTAWQALTRQQRETVLDVPGLSSESARAIDKALCEKRVPAECVQLLQYVRDAVARLAGKKHGSTPFAAEVRTAEKYQKVAMAFYARAGKKYPLPVLPAIDAIPAEKVARDAFILTFARADIERQYKDNLQHAVTGLAAATDALENPDSGATWYMHSRNAEGARDRARNALASANKALILYSRLHGSDKKSRAAQAAIKALGPVFQALEKRVADAQALEKRERIERAIKRYSHARGMVGKGNAAPHHVRNMQESIYHASGIASESLTVGIPKDSWLFDVAEKMARSHAVDALQREVGQLGNRIHNGDSYYDAGHFADAKREYIGYMRKYAHIAGLDVPARALAHFAGSTMARHADIAERMASIDAAILEKNKEAIAAWIDGTSDVRPGCDVGTFARINAGRGVVETTRGANVPIEHACRLARLYAIGVRRGGQEWADGAGPMVGHYRVNKIGADGALVIGCHEFTPSEAKRLQTLLESCPACAEG